MTIREAQVIDAQRSKGTKPNQTKPNDYKKLQNLEMDIKLQPNDQMSS